MEVFIKEEEKLTGLQDVAVAKYEHYEERRNEKLDLARQERNMIVGFLEEAQRTGKVSPQARKFMKLAGASTEKKGLSDAEKIALAEAEKSKSSMLEEEKRRVIAMKQRQQKEIEQMIEQINVNFCDYDKRTPLHLASSEGHVEIVKFLLLWLFEVLAITLLLEEEI